MTLMRYALVGGLAASEAKVAAYLPANYRVMGMVTICPLCRTTLDDIHGVRGCRKHPTIDTDEAVVIGGRDRDNGGFGLDKYVIPRLGSGLMWAVEIDLSHPAMKEIPIDA